MSKKLKWDGKHLCRRDDIAKTPKWCMELDESFGLDLTPNDDDLQDIEAKDKKEAMKKFADFIFKAFKKNASRVKLSDVEKWLMDQRESGSKIYKQCGAFESCLNLIDLDEIICEDCEELIHICESGKCDCKESYESE